MPKETTRRAFLAGAAVLGAGALLEGAGLPWLSGLLERLPAALASPPLRREGGLVRLPSRGTLYVASDFHARYADFKKWLAITDLPARLAGEKDAYGLILGDAVDIKGSDSEADKEGDRRILDDLMKLRSDTGGEKSRLVFIQGNHEFEVVKAYRLLLDDHGLNEGNRDELVKKLYEGKNGSFYRQFNFLERITPEQFRFLETRPTLTLCDRGLVGVHAGPSRSLASLKDVVDLKSKVIDEIVWSRPAEIKDQGYTAEDMKRFLLLTGGRLILSGHTPLGYLPESWIRHGVGICYGKQIILATSYGSSGGAKSWLKLDLSRAFGKAEDLASGKEIFPL